MSTPKNTQTSTPTPWKVSALDYWSIVGDGKHIADCRVQDERTIGRSRDHESEANAELIVRAVNAHEQLTAALSGIIAAIEQEDCDGTVDVSRLVDDIEAARAALRAARGEK